MNQLGESLPNFIFAVVNLDPIVLEKRWTDGESWPYEFVEKVKDVLTIEKKKNKTHKTKIKYSVWKRSTTIKFVKWGKVNKKATLTTIVSSVCLNPNSPVSEIRFGIYA